MRLIKLLALMRRLKKGEVMKRAFFFICVVSMLAGCSASIDGDASGRQTKPGGFEDLAQGPDISGYWKSECVLDKYNDAYRQRSLKVDLRQVVRTDNVYNDKDCTVLQKKTEYKGAFRWLKQTTYGGYQLEYKFDLGGGWTTSLKEEILVEENSLHLSNFLLGYDSIDKTMPLVKMAALVDCINILSEEK